MIGSIIPVLILFGILLWIAGAFDSEDTSRWDVEQAIRTEKPVASPPAPSMSEADAGKYDAWSAGWFDASEAEDED